MLSLDEPEPLMLGADGPFMVDEGAFGPVLDEPEEPLPICEEDDGGLLSRPEPLPVVPVPSVEVEEPEDVPLDFNPLPCAEVSVVLVDEPLPVVVELPEFDGAVAVEPVRLF